MKASPDNRDMSELVLGASGSTLSRRIWRWLTGLLVSGGNGTYVPRPCLQGMYVVTRDMLHIFSENSVDCGYIVQPGIK